MSLGIMTIGIAVGQLFAEPISDVPDRKKPLIVGIGGPYTAIPMGVTMVVCSLVALVCYYRFSRPSK